MSATAAPVAQPRAPRRPAVLPRLVSFFSGSVGFGVKLALLALLNALDVWALFVLLDRRHWVAAGVLVAATLLVDWLYLAAPAGAIPWKFLVPGTVFLVAFQIAPIVYTVDVSFTNYSTGHITTKADAIKQIQVTSLQPPPNGKQYTMAAAHDSGGHLVLILKDDATGKAYVGTKKGLKEIPSAGIVTGALGITAAKGYTILKGNELFSLDQTLQSYVVPVGKAGIRPEGISQAVELEPTLRWDPARGVFTRIADGAVFRDDGKGSFRSAAGEELEPGWKTYVGGTNFSRIWNDPQVRHPFIRVFVWTLAFATLTVFFSFAIGLFLAIALNKPGMRFLRVYRSFIVIPWAVPGFLSLLVWQGLLNDDFGVVNRIFHLSVPWLFDANWAKVSVILVSVWLTVPYFFLVSLGALQSIPEELNEAARVDGGGPLQLFRRVTLPLLMVAVSPLLIASFAFNFNNFNNIYLLTSGGPPQGDNPIAGATDILISYTYKLAIQTGKGQDFGLAAAFTIVIFLIVATISAISFSKTKALENIN